MSKTAEVIIKPSKQQTKKAITKDEELAPPIQNRFDKNSVEDMKKLKSLKDKIKRCEKQISKHQLRLNELNNELGNYSQ